MPRRRGAALPATTASAAPLAAPPDALGLLYDATLCIGCKTCVVACQDANGLPRDPTGIDYRMTRPWRPTQSEERHQVVQGRERRTVVHEGAVHALHRPGVCECVHDRRALTRGANGIVSYNVDYCVGCRYCEIACPFNVPKFEWAKNTPQIVKCELCCRQRLAENKGTGMHRSLSASCGHLRQTRELLLEAKRRIAAEPDKHQPKVYGETEAGGTQCLHLACAVRQARVADARRSTST